MAMALEMMPECARTFLSHSMSIPCHSMHCKVQKHQPFSGKKLLIFVEGQLGQGERPWSVSWSAQSRSLLSVSALYLCAGLPFSCTKSSNLTDTSDFLEANVGYIWVVLWLTVLESQSFVSLSNQCLMSYHHTFSFCAPGKAVCETEMVGPRVLLTADRVRAAKKTSMEGWAPQQKVDRFQQFLAQTQCECKGLQQHPNRIQLSVAWSIIHYSLIWFSGRKTSRKSRARAARAWRHKCRSSSWQANPCHILSCFGSWRFRRVKLFAWGWSTFAPLIFVRVDLSKMFEHVYIQ